MADAVFKQFNEALSKPENKEQAKKINGIFQFKLSSPNADYVLDTKSGKAYKGTDAKADVTLTLTDKDFQDLMSGKGNGQQMFMSGKIKFKGNMGLLMKLGDLAKLAK